MTEQNNAAIAKARAGRGAERLEEAKATVQRLPYVHGEVGLALPNIWVPRMTEKGDFYWPGRHIPVRGEILDAVVKARGARDQNVVRYQGGEISRGADGKFPPVVVIPVKAKWNHPILIEASHKSLMRDLGRQFLADPKNIALLRNNVRTSDGTRRVVGVEALVQLGSQGPFVAFAGKGDLLKRLEQSPRIAPYLAKALVQLNGQYQENVVHASQKRGKGNGMEL
ncbi:hypothetical protein GCM10019059_36090 [Camelimonas fluminis]|uniref:Uncharacterized protein n=1 Tax=Camelimonas fluminis TaxID=1576911 RepID=A0ABV7UIU4_9HYPH|nr:hypothetical protein [Camelimonas fluminis]GHE73279.1 hypothetical protein GCM10019059_36090 [Camelimonas fluminis]